MLFSSITFLYYFFPILLLVYFLTPNRFRNHILLLFSILFYFYGEPKYLFLLFLLMIYTYGAGRYLMHKKHQRLILLLSLCILFLCLFIFKYLDFLLLTLQSLFHSNGSLFHLIMPIGISFYTFQMSSYLIDVYHGKVNASDNLLSFCLYIIMFPQLIAGPIVRYQDIEKQLDDRRHSCRKFNEGISRFIVGLSKKVILADTFGYLCSELMNIECLDFIGGWLFAIAATFQIYYDFSGYSDMAIGLGKIFGFTLPENFNHPLMAISITDFWKRWHMTLSSWFRDYIYIPLGGNKKGRKIQLRNILIVWLLTGIWHGATFNFVLWGVFYAILLIIEKCGVQKYVEKYKIIGHIYTLFFVLISFVIFKIENYEILVSTLKSMFTITSIHLQTLYYVQSYAGYLLIGIMASTSYWKIFTRRIKKFDIIKYIICILLLLICTGYLVDGNYRPFLYFRF